ncbi:MAG: hypothetical protein OER92_08980 [Alphaproteobacteria bacterium]|nr:hypothetical protein [Alphaproteobacteria bacterium]
MRPQSVVNFEILFVSSIVLGSIVSVLTWDKNVDGLSFEALLVAEIIGMLAYIALALWASRKGSNIARWIILVIIVLGFLGIWLNLSEIGQMGPIVVFTIPVYMVLQIAANLFLWSSGAQPWFEKS